MARLGMAGTADAPRRRRRVALRAFVAVAALAVLAGVAGAAVFAGYLSASRGTFPSEFLARVDHKLEETFFDDRPPEQLVSGPISSHLIDLQMTVSPLDLERDLPFHTLAGNGGGLASFGDDVLLLPYGGRVFAMDAAGEVRPTGLQAPDNDREAYEEAAADPALEGHDVRPGYLRYNDLLHYESGRSRGLVASYTEYHAEKACYTNTVARLDLPADVGSIDEVSAGPGDWEVLHRTSPCLEFKERHYAMEGHMAGGRMAFEAPSTLYVTSGDYHIDGMRSEPGYAIAQDPDAEYGKLLAIDVETGEARIVSSGHRNPQGITLASDGTLYVVEHGPRGGDELNVIREGANYGWPLESLGTTYYGRGPIPGAVSYGRHDTFEPPIHAWVPSVATSAMVEVAGVDPAWNGDLLVASLLDGSLHRLRLEEDHVAYGERIEIGSRLRDLIVHDGRIVIWTDNQELIALAPGERTDLAQTFARFVDAYDLSDDLAARLDAALAGCAECHSFQPGDHVKAPGLARIHGDPLGSTEFDGYSGALRAEGGTWTSQRLAAYIRAPSEFAPGTSMPAPGIEDDALIGQLVAYLEEIDQTF